MKRSSSIYSSGFTLLEIMLVVMIIALLAGAAIYGLGGNIGYAQEVRVRGDVQSIGTQLMMYQATNGSYPTTSQGLRALVSKPTEEPVPRSWRNLLPEMPKDPWGLDYQYIEPGVHNPNGYDLFSNGGDQKPNTADDIGNWKESTSK